MAARFLIIFLALALESAADVATVGEHRGARCPPDELAIEFCNAGLFAADGARLWRLLAAVTNATIAEVDQSSSTTDVALSGILVGSDADVETLTYGISGATVAGSTATLDGSYGTLTLDTATGAYSYAKNAAAIEARRAPA